ncbi:MAG: hypothetical protein RLZZ292_2203 [Bacteroidota bacterium]|jgi:hypothetical protein
MKIIFLLGFISCLISCGTTHHVAIKHFKPKRAIIEYEFDYTDGLQEVVTNSADIIEKKLKAKHCDVRFFTVGTHNKDLLACDAKMYEYCIGNNYSPDLIVYIWLKKGGIKKIVYSGISAIKIDSIHRDRFFGEEYAGPQKLDKKSKQS